MRWLHTQRKTDTLSHALPHATGGDAKTAIAPAPRAQNDQVVLEGKGPANGPGFRQTMKTMDKAWCGMRLKYPRVAYLKDLHMEDVTAVADFVLGPRVAGKTRADGLRLPWAEVLPIFNRVRDSWWDWVRAGKTLREARLQ